MREKSQPSEQGFQRLVEANHMWKRLAMLLGVIATVSTLLSASLGASLYVYTLGEESRAAARLDGQTFKNAVRNEVDRALTESDYASRQEVAELRTQLSTTTRKMDDLKGSVDRLLGRLEERQRGQS